MPLQTICATLKAGESLAAEFVGWSKPSSRDRRSRGSRLVRLFRPQNCGAVARALAETGRVEDDRKLSRFHNGFYLQGDRSTTYAERGADCKLARLSDGIWSIAPSRCCLYAATLRSVGIEDVTELANLHVQVGFLDHPTRPDGAHDPRLLRPVPLSARSAWRAD